jgi:hypothetical protein
MQNAQSGASGLLNVNQLEQTAFSLVFLLCSSICRPIEMILRPFSGTRYYPITVIFFSTGLVIVMPIVSVLTTSVVSMIPLVHARPPSGMFGVGSLFQVYFALTAIHAVRLYRRMIHPETEEHSEYEGDPLPIFYLLPKGRAFWFTRIVWEPLFVIFLATVLGHMFILQSGLVLYLQLAGLALMMKQFIRWYKSWEYIRGIMDARFAGPIIARMAENQATDDELSRIHMASFPKGTPDDIRRSMAANIARSIDMGER